jgi:integrase/recombinase XerD
MSDLRRHSGDYLDLRRALGYKLAGEGRLLADFVDFLEKAEASTVTTALAAAWTTQVSGSAAYIARRMRVARHFARYLHALDPGTEVPSDGLFPAGKHRPVPYIFSADDVDALMAAARTLKPAIRAATFETLIGLLAATGMRVGEAIALDVGDIDWPGYALAVRESKYGKSREILLHSSAIDALKSYGVARDRFGRPRPGSSFFISVRGSRLSHNTVQPTFRHLVRLAGLEKPPGSPQPRIRIHCFRHSFAVDTLIAWYRDGGDVAVRIPVLSTYLGHVDPRSTYWYVSGVPELLALAAQRLETADRTRP